MPKRKNSRQCATPGCKLTPTLYPHCPRCRTANCGGRHEHTHFDSNHAVVCDDCGATVKTSTKKKGKNTVGNGKRTGWMANGIAAHRAQKAQPTTEGGMVS